MEFLPTGEDNIMYCHVHVWDETCIKTQSSNGGSTWTRLIADTLTGGELIESNRLLLPGKEVTPLVFGSCSSTTELSNAVVLKSMQKHGFPALYRTSYEMTAEELKLSRTDIEDIFYNNAMRLLKK